jgi:hypothetical protein
MFEKHAGTMIDKVNPFQIAEAPIYPDANFRDFIAPMFAAMAITTHHDLRDAWEAIVTHPAYPHDSHGVVTADDVSDAELKEMLTKFDGLPMIDGPNGTTFDLGDPKTLADVRAGWLRGGWTKHGLWDAEQSPIDAMRARLDAFFREQYHSISHR